jgi:hypothetical protein
MDPESLPEHVHDRLVQILEARCGKHESGH